MIYIKEILKKNKILVLGYLALGIFNAFMLNFKADVFQKIVDGLTRRDITLANILFYGGILIVSYCMNYVDNYPEKKLEHGIYLDFKLLTLGKISRIDYMAYQRYGTGKLVQQIENGAEAGRNLLCNYWFVLIRQLIPTILFSIFFIWRIDRRITYILLAGYAVIFLVTNLLLKSLCRIKERILDSEERLNHFMVRGFMEMLVFRMNRQFPNEIRKARQARHTIVASKVKMTMIHEAFFTIFALLVAFLDIGILVYAWFSGKITVGAVVALITLVDNAYTPIAIFNVLYVQYKLNRASYARFEEFLDQKEDGQLDDGAEISDFRGEIRIDRLCYQYEQREIFNNLSLAIHPGEKVAFVGESGSGKSTLVKLLAGLLKYDRGSIRLDDAELRELSLEKLYRQMVYLSQDAPVFDGTIRENLAFDREVPEEQMLSVLEKVQLLTLVNDSADGLDTAIGERGSVISGGEKQRLALARLWFRESKLVILDEATSAMDNLTEEAVMGEVMALLREQTVIAIAHRLNTVINFDRIVVFRQGEIVGQGTFAQLMEHNEYFRELYHASKQA